MQLFEISQAAMDQLGACGGGVRRQVILLTQQYGEATACGIARDAGAIDAATHHQKVVAFHSAHLAMPLRATPNRLHAACAIIVTMLTLFFVSVIDILGFGIVIPLVPYM